MTSYTCILKTHYALCLIFIYLNRYYEYIIYNYPLVIE